MAANKKVPRKPGKRANLPAPTDTEKAEYAARRAKLFHTAEKRMAKIIGTMQEATKAIAAELKHPLWDFSLEDGPHTHDGPDYHLFQAIRLAWRIEHCLVSAETSCTDLAMAHEGTLEGNPFPTGASAAERIQDVFTFARIKAL